MKIFTKGHCSICGKNIEDNVEFYFGRKARMKKSQTNKSYQWTKEGSITVIKTVEIEPRPSFIGGTGSRAAHSFAICTDCFSTIGVKYT